MRAPPESLNATSGMPDLMAKSISSTILSACILPSVPADTVKSWLKAATSCPLT
jgi:hypothetical protein